MLFLVMFIVIEDLVVYQKALSLAKAIYAIVEKWEYFYQQTLGTQLVRAANSISANISEGYGRYYFKDRKTFLYYARGSLYETKTHLAIAKDRCLFSEDKGTELFEMAEELLKILNAYIKATGPKQ